MRNLAVLETLEMLFEALTLASYGVLSSADTPVENGTNGNKERPVGEGLRITSSGFYRELDDLEAELWRVVQRRSARYMCISEGVCVKCRLHDAAKGNRYCQSCADAAANRHNEEEGVA